MGRFSTRQDAIERVIVPAIESGGESAEDYDIEGIADRVLGGFEDGYAQVVDESDFWDAVADCAL